MYRCSANVSRRSSELGSGRCREACVPHRLRDAPCAVGLFPPDLQEVALIRERSGRAYGAQRDGVPPGACGSTKARENEWKIRLWVEDGRVVAWSWLEEDGRDRLEHDVHPQYLHLLDEILGEPAGRGGTSRALATQTVGPVAPLRDCLGEGELASGGIAAVERIASAREQRPRELVELAGPEGDR